MKPYFESGEQTIYHGRAEEIVPTLGKFDLLMTDPPYGISYCSGMTGHNGGVSLPGIVGDEDASLRDEILAMLSAVPSIVFGSWKVARPANTRAVLIWEKGDHVGMGDLSLPWKPNTEEIYVLGHGFSGHRGSSVLRFNAPVSWNSTAFGRQHPHQKPLDLIKFLLSKCPQGSVIDPFMGSGTTLIAAKAFGLRAVGIEVEEAYCEIAATRLAQEVLF